MSKGGGAMLPMILFFKELPATFIIIEMGLKQFKPSFRKLSTLIKQWVDPVSIKD
jgi:hypothetical protein